MAAGDVSKSLLAQVRFRIGEPTASRWTDAELYGYLNEAQMVLAQEEALDAAMPSLTETRNGKWTAGTYSYSLPADFLRERYVAVGGVMARRLELLDLDALRSNVFYAPAKATPFYSIVEGAVSFHTGGADPTVLTYTLYYVRKPMRVRAVTSLAGTELVVPTHGLTTVANAQDPLALEDMVASGTAYNDTVTLAAVSDANTLALAAGSTTATGGRMVHPWLGQIAADEDPLLGPIFYGFIMDWAVARAREQVLERGERDRMMQHFRQRVEALKQRYGSGRPHDNIVGDPARRQAG